MATVAQLAQLASVVYDEQKAQQGVGDWKFIDKRGGTSSGFYGALFLDTKRRTFGLCFRGTDDAIDGFVDDRQILLGKVPDQLRHARAFLKVVRPLARFGKKSLYLTGHSLGGGLASFLAVDNKLPAVTFNSPSMTRSYADSVVSRTLGRDFGNTNFDTSRILHIEAAGDVVSIGPKFGKVVKIHFTGINQVPKPKNPPLTLNPVQFVKGTVESLAEHAASALLQHSMERMEKQIRSMPQFHKELGWNYETVEI